MFFRASVAASLTYLFIALARLAHDAPAAPAAVAPPPSLPQSTRVVDVRRSELDALASGPPHAARIVPALRDGAPIGFKLYAIRPGSPLAAIGLENGDTVLAVNDTAVTSPDAALEVYRPLRQLDHLDLDVERRGERLRILVLVH